MLLFWIFIVTQKILALNWEINFDFDLLKILFEIYYDGYNLIGTRWNFGFWRHRISKNGPSVYHRKYRVFMNSRSVLFGDVVYGSPLKASYSWSLQLEGTCLQKTNLPANQFWIRHQCFVCFKYIRELVANSNIINWSNIILVSLLFRERGTFFICL